MLEAFDLKELRRQCAWCGFPVPRDADAYMHDGCRDEADATD